MNVARAGMWGGWPWSAKLAIGMLGALTLLVLLVPALATTSPLAMEDVLASRLRPPFSRGADGTFHLLGTDRFGRDLFARMMLAGRLSLAIGILGSGGAAAVGVMLGAAAAWTGGVADRLITAVADAMQAIPRLVLLLVCATLWQPGVTTVFAILVATGWMGTMRLVRAEALGLRGRPFIEAARAAGVPEGRILVRHVLPNALGPAIVAATLGVGNAILLESGLSFLGLGVQPPTPSWGNMIAGGRDLIVTAPWVAIAPGVALVLTVLAATLLGDALRDRLAGETSVGGAASASERA